MIKAYKITPSPDCRFTDLYIKEDGKTWQEALFAAQSSLDSQFFEKEWSEIEVTIKCVEITEEFWEECLNNAQN